MVIGRKVLVNCDMGEGMGPWKMVSRSDTAVGFYT